LDNKKNDNVRTLPVVALINIVIMPKNTITIEVGRKSTINAINKAIEKDNMIFLSCQKNIEDKSTNIDSIYKTGVIAKILDVYESKGKDKKVVIQTIERGEVLQQIENKEFFEASIKTLKTEEPDADEDEYLAILRLTIEAFEQYAKIYEKFSPKMLLDVLNAELHGELADLICENMKLNIEKKQSILEELNATIRLSIVLSSVYKEIEVTKIQKELLLKVKESVDTKQKEYILKEQVNIIQKELGQKEDTLEEIEKYNFNMAKKNPPIHVKEKFEKEIKRLTRMQSTSPETNNIRDYIECLIDIPWTECSKESISIENAKKILEQEHYGLEDIKERIIEFIAVKQFNNDIKVPILCFVGAPGVGKTSIVKSIATSLNREIVRISLGGVRDEADIRGHRRTYMGANHGRIIYSLKQAKTNNPIILLDEIDKINSDFKGNPYSALLEVLDYEQNKEFRDHYLEIPYDLSNVMFICTANTTKSISSALIDRLEIIQLSSYTMQEKIEIVSKFIYPKQLKKYKIEKNNISINKETLEHIINNYTKEAGVRELERIIEKIFRKIIKEMVEDETKNEFNVSKGDITKYLGTPKFKKDKALDKPQIGVVKGLAYTAVGGTTLSIEANVMKGNGKIKLTGNLGNIMKESATTSISYIRSNYEKFGISQNFYQNYDIHVHIPEGGTPKDGPSAGITMASAIVSAFTGVAAKNDVAMTGEITLRGNVLPIGGLKEKILAAKNVGISKVIIPFDNEADLLELPCYIKEGIQFVLVKHMNEVLINVLENEGAFNGS
jgi:ATP-dependent Lon protease